MVYSQIESKKHGYEGKLPMGIRGSKFSELTKFILLKMLKKKHERGFIC